MVWVFEAGVGVGAEVGTVGCGEGGQHLGVDPGGEVGGGYVGVSGGSL